MNGSAECGIARRELGGCCAGWGGGGGAVARGGGGRAEVSSFFSARRKKPELYAAVESHPNVANPATLGWGTLKGGLGPEKSGNVPVCPGGAGCPLSGYLAALFGGRLPLQSCKQEKDYRKHHANQNRTSQRKIEGSVLPAVRNISRQAAERQARSTEQHDDAPNHHQGHADHQQHPSRLHASSLTPQIANLDGG